MKDAPKKQDEPAEQSLSQSKYMDYEYDTLMSMLRTSVSKHLLNESFTLVWANDFYYQLIGYPQAEYEAKFHNRPDLYYPAHGYEDERLKLTDEVVRALKEGRKGYSLITRLPVKGGGHRWVRMVATFVDEYIDGYQVSYTAITDIDDLVRAQMNQSITYNNIPGFMARYLVKAGGGMELLEANQQFKEFFGFQDDGTYEALFQRNWTANQEAIEPQLAVAREGKPVRFLAKFTNRREETAWMQVSGECVDWIGEEPVYLLVYIDVTDLTDLREMQKKLEDQAQQLSEALQEAEKANRAKSDFLSRMSHDIRTPMNAIVGMTEIAGAHLQDPEKVRDCLRKISISSQHLLGLINDVLDMSKIESGKMTLHEESMFLPEVMESIVSILQPMIKSRKQSFTIRLRHLRHERIFCDALRLKQCCINILSNASKFTPPEGKISVDVEEEPSPKSGVACLAFTFADTGIGIQPKFMDHIFDAFSREMDNRVDKTEGSGLGMAITKKIVDLMGGTIEVQSAPGRGTTFVVRLAMRIDGQVANEICFPNLKVLVADDDRVMCEYTAQTLRECGVQAQWVDSGEEAVRQILLARERGEDFDALILDWKMPGLDGLQTVRKIRTQLKSAIPILIASAYDWYDIEQEARAAGVNGFLPKPLFRSTLCRGLCRYVLGKEDAAHGRPREQRYDFSGKRILLVEDNALNREVAVELLSETAAVIDCACDGAEGVNMFAHANEGYYDLILMDLQMPVMNGYAATRAIRGLKRADAGVPILAMTADAFAEDVAATREAGMNGHLTKPLDAAAMKRELARFLAG